MAAVGTNIAGNIETGINVAGMGVWLAGEAAIAQARADRRHRNEVLAHNARIAAIRNARRRAATAAAAEEAAAIERGRARMSRWIDIVTN